VYGILQKRLNMNIKAITLAAILGLATPVVTELITTTQVLANPSFPSGDYSDGLWLITLSYQDNVRHYSGRNLKTGDTIALSGSNVSGNNQQWVYTWLNDKYRYQVAWQPEDPDVIRLQVLSPSGKAILNRLLQRQIGE
jgi:hypothetical protein